MKFRIIAGHKKIGGNVIEIENKIGKKIYLDMGMPIDLPEKGEFSSAKITHRSHEELMKSKYLPDVKGLYEGNDSSVSAVLLSHPHLDHFGFLGYIHESIPVYAGEAAKKIIDVSRDFTPQKVDIKNYRPLSDLAILEFDGFRITPYLVDHSAFDAYSFLIEADERILFYSGDIRAHGRKKSLFDRLIRELPKDKKIHAFLVEGTMLGRANEEYVTEEDLESKFIQSIKKTTGLVLVNYSSQNIDRMVTVYRSAIQADRHFIMDGYSAVLYRKINHPTLPRDTWEKVRVYLNKSYKRKALIEQRLEELVGDYKINRIYPEEIAKRPDKYVLCFREGMVQDFDCKWKNHIPSDSLVGASFIYSMYFDYFKRMTRLKEFLDQHKISFEQIHCPGHAYTKDLKRLVDEVNPVTVFPIHTLEQERFSDLCNNVKFLDFMQWEQL
ncbi:MAG: MBL fold metallo-hydrolase [Oligoflexia bacterium]|nr:MBL fold metallo-hydrolase [Oligoflexia bacterium]